MNGPWTVLFFEDHRGRQPIREWLDELALERPGEHRTVRRAIDLLGGPPLPRSGEGFG
jgi:hypothetical protein